MKNTALNPGAHRADFIHKIVDEYLTKREQTDEETRQREIFKRDGGRKALKSRAATATESANPK
jgi:hypothetical protein